MAQTWRDPTLTVRKESDGTVPATPGPAQQTILSSRRTPHAKGSDARPALTLLKESAGGRGASSENADVSPQQTTLSSDLTAQLRYWAALTLLKDSADGPG